MKNTINSSLKLLLLVLGIIIISHQKSYAQSWSTSGDTISSSGYVKATNLNVIGTNVLMPGLVSDTATDLLGINRQGKVSPLTGHILHGILYPSVLLIACDTTLPLWYTQSVLGAGTLVTKSCTWVGIGEAGLSNFPDAPLSVSNSTSNILFSAVNPTSLHDVFTIDKNGNTVISGSGSIGNQLTVNTSSTAGQTATFLNGGSGVLFTTKMQAWDFSHLSEANDNGIFWADNYGTGNVHSGFVIAPWSNSIAGIRIDPAGNTTVNGTIIANGNSSLWTTSASSPYTPATSNTNGGWTVPLLIPDGSAIRIATTDHGHYLGFGMVDEATTGWYWMVEGKSNDSATACYPMTLILDGSGNATLTISQNGWCDYVFDPNYKPMSIEEKENYYKIYKHLPGIDSASTVQQKGLNITKNMTGMLQNLEEDRLDITKLYDIIQQQMKEIEDLKNELSSIKQQK